ncbi:MAG: hypothetical protein ACI4EA_07610 [Candidatus Ornithomonoglobus sp.]
MRKEYNSPTMAISYFGDGISTAETDPVIASQYAVDAAKDDFITETFQSNPKRVAIFQFSE